MIRHGDYLGYFNDGCRCRACTDAVVRYDADRTLRGMRGEIWADMPAVHAAISPLLKMGVSPTAIADAAGVSFLSVRKAVRCEGRIHKEVGDKIAAVTVDDLPDTSLVDMDLMRPLVGILRDRGWTWGRIGFEVLGWPDGISSDTWMSRGRVGLGKLRAADVAVGCWECGGVRVPGLRVCYGCTVPARRVSWGSRDTCGTRWGAQRHRREGEVACGVCKAAEAKRRRELRQKVSA